MNRDELRAKSLAFDDLPREPVEVPWVGEKLYVRGLTATEKDQWVARTMPGGDFVWTNNLTAELVVKTLVNEDGERIFDDEDAEAVGKKGAAVLSMLFATAMRLSGLTEEEAQAVEADFPNARSSGSSSG